MPNEASASTDTQNDDSKPITRAEFNALVASIDQKVGGAVANQLTTSLKKLDLGKQVSDAVATAFKSSKETEAPAGDVTADTASKASKVDPQVLKDRETLKALEKKLADSEARREAAEKKEREGKALSALRSSLNGKVRPEAVEVLVKAFRADITFDDEGEPMLPVDGGTTPIAAAIESWAKSKDAAAFVPAPNAGGSGGSGSAKSKTNGGTQKPFVQMSSEEKLDAFERMNAARSA